MRAATLLLALVLLAACNRDRSAEESRALAARALRGALAYPQSSLISVSAGSDAAQMEFSSATSAQDIAAWYRRALAANGWEIHSDATDQGGTVSIYAEKGKQPLWITLRPNVGGPGSSYTLVGAVGADSTK